MLTRKVLLMIVLGLLLSASIGPAQEPPFDFKGIALGSDLAIIENTSRFSCKDPQSPLADRACSLQFGQKETIAGAPVQVLLLYYYGGKLERISVSFEERYFSQVAAALVEKYGEAAVNTEALQNRMGVSFENRIYSWRREPATLEARRHFGKLDRSHVEYRTDFAQQEFARRRATTSKEKAKDL